MPSVQKEQPGILIQLGIFITSIERGKKSRSIQVGGRRPNSDLIGEPS